MPPQAQLLQELISAQRDFIHIAAIAKKPDMSSPSFAKLVEPTQKALMAITDIKDKHRGHKQFNHLSTVAEGVPAFGWIAVVSTPMSLTTQCSGASIPYPYIICLGTYSRALHSRNGKCCPVLF